jgi:multidrug efflux system outer membrane protein
LENAIAILAGSNPSSFHLAAETPGNWNPPTPEIPAGLPSDLLERRPDVAQAERQLASANARIGVAKAAFFPVLTLTGSGGYLSADVDTCSTGTAAPGPSAPSLSLPIFAGGRNKANYQRSKAVFEESVANYRQQVLVAFGEVEDSLSGIRHLADQSSAQQRAVTHARRAVDLATDRYRPASSAISKSWTPAGTRCKPSAATPSLRASASSPMFNSSRPSAAAGTIQRWRLLAIASVKH